MSGSQARDRLYQLLPALYRQRDKLQGEALRALLGILEEEMLLVERDIDRQYDNWFIETCDEWTVPYLGDLIGARSLRKVSQRVYTANHVAYGRRKGTLPGLESLTRDVTRWPARAVEFMQRVLTTQSVNYERPSNSQVPNLRKQAQLNQIAGAFDQAAHNADLRAAGRYQISQVGLYLWRLEAFPLSRVQASPIPVAELPVGLPSGAFFRANALGCDQAMWSAGQPLRDDVIDESCVPQPLSRRALYDVLEARRQALVDGHTPTDRYFIAGQPVLAVYVPAADGTPQAIPAEEILIADLSTCWLPATSKTYQRASDSQSVTVKISVAVDPQNGRLAFPSDATHPVPQKVWCSYYYGGAAELGGGGYDRATSMSVVDGIADTAFVKIAAGDPTHVLTSLNSGSIWATLATAAGKSLSDVHRFVLEIGDSQTYTMSAISVPAGIELELRSHTGQRPRISPQSTSAPTTLTLGDGAALTLSGLLLTGQWKLARATSAISATMTLSHCTLVPGIDLLSDGSPRLRGAPNLQSDTGWSSLSVSLSKCISGPLRLPTDCGALHILDSIVDATGGTASDSDAIVGQWARVQRSTIFGTVRVGSLRDTIDALLCDALTTTDAASNRITSSFVQTDAAAQALVRPWFRSRRYGTPDYALLDMRCAPEIRQVGTDGAEVGVMHDLLHGQRESSLVSACQDHLRFGVSLNLIYVT